jgi:hypothetical protein
MELLFPNFSRKDVEKATGENLQTRSKNNS